MEYLVLVVIGFFFGYCLGWLHEFTTKWIYGKQEVDDYMKNTYGEDWCKFKNK